jgi:hypothetical protein
MPYRRSGGTLTVRTAAAGLEIVTSPDGLAITGRLSITRDTATFQTRRGREQQAIRGCRIVVARNALHRDVAIWMEWRLDRAGSSCMRRIFGIAPDPAVPCHQLDAAFRQIRDALRLHGGGWLRATELGRGDEHPMLLVERHDRHEVYASRLFREHAQLVMTIVPGEDCVVHHPATEGLHLGSQVAIRVRGQEVRFVGDGGRGADMAGIPLPWLAPEERRQFARRLARALDGSGPQD